MISQSDFHGSQHFSAPPVSIVVLNYNGERVLPDLLDSLDRLSYPNLRIFLVDNASLDRSIEIIKAHLQNSALEIIQNKSNLMFSAGNNIGIRKAMEWGAEFILLLNNDTIVPSDMISQLVDFLRENSKAGIAGPLIHYADPPGTIWSAGGRVNMWWGLVRHHGIRKKDVNQFSSPMKVDYISGAAMMIRVEVIDRIGLLDESFPMYYEDTDFCFRAGKAGFESWFVPTKPLIHKVSSAAGGQFSRFKITRRFFSGMKFFIRHARWYQMPTIIVGQIYEILRVGTTLLLPALVSGRK